MSTPVFIIEPFFTGSHRSWVEGFSKYYPGTVTAFTLKGQHWKWRMASGAIQLAELVNQADNIPEWMLVSDMLDLGLFKGLLSPRFRDSRIAIYFHENQLTYPWDEANYKDHDRHYAWINFTSMLSADSICFNSQFHLEEVFRALPKFLNAFPDSFSNQLPGLKEKSRVIYPGIDDEIRHIPINKGNRLRLLWNHRWEFDKNPELFFRTLIDIHKEGLDFELVVCGEQYAQCPDIFNEARKILAPNIIHWGYTSSHVEYLELIASCHLIPVTSTQEFYGLSVMEAVLCGVYPLLPMRLSYPELYQNVASFYHSDEEFSQELRRLIQIGEVPKPEFAAEPHLWSKVAASYRQMWLEA